MPEVSVIIPNYNHAPYLKQRIDSILSQTYQDFELIILDDRSSDNSREIINQYAGNEKVAHIVFNDTNSGSTFKQWHTGIELAKGKYIWIAESDDWCEPTLLETLVNGLLNNKQCVLAYIQTLIIDQNNKITGSTDHNMFFEYVEGHAFIQKHLVSRNAICNASMAIFKKESYFHVSSAYTDFKFCGDWIFWIELAKQGEVFISGKVLNYFRTHTQNVTGGMHTSGINYIEELMILKALKNQSLITLEEFKANLFPRYIAYKRLNGNFTPEVNLMIKESFFYDGTQSFKRELILRNYYNLLKTTLKRYFKK